MKPQLDKTPELPLLPILRVLCYLELQEYTLEYGVVEFSNRWYTPARQMMSEIYRNAVWSD